MKSETSIQIELWKLIETYKLPNVLVFHIPNGEKRGIKTAMRLKQMGVLPGVPDFCYIANFRVGFLELKRADGRPSNAQLEFMGEAAWNLILVDVAHSVSEGAQILQKRGVFDPNINFISDDPSDRGRAGRTVRKRAVRPTKTTGAN